MEILLGLIPLIGWGAGDIFAIYPLRKIGAYRTSAYSFLAGLLLTSLYVPFALSEFHLITFGLLFLNVLSGSLYLFGNVLVGEAFRQSSASLVGIIIQAFPAVVLVLSAIIFKDSISPQQIIFISIVFVGVFLCTVDFGDLKAKKIIKDKGIKYALIAAGIFSLYFTFLRVFVDAYGWFWPNYISFASFPLALFLAKKIFSYKEKVSLIKSKLVLFSIIMSALLLRAGDIALNVGISMGLSSVVAPLAGSAPILFVILSRLIYKDPITTQQKYGIGVTLIGILLLSFV